MKNIEFKQKTLNETNKSLIIEYLDIDENDSGNLEKTIQLMDDNVIFLKRMDKQAKKSSNTRRL
jgi:hypothetical protein